MNFQKLISKLTRYIPLIGLPDFSEINIANTPKQGIQTDALAPSTTNAKRIVNIRKKLTSKLAKD